MVELYLRINSDGKQKLESILGADDLKNEEQRLFASGAETIFVPRLCRTEEGHTFPSHKRVIDSASLGYHTGSEFIDNGKAYRHLRYEKLI